MLLLAIAGAARLAVAQTSAPAAHPEIAAASVRWLCTGECRGLRTQHPYTADPERFSCDGCLMVDLLLIAYPPKEGKVSGEPSWVGWDLYNIDFATTSPVTREQMIHVLLPEVLARCFALRVRKVTKVKPGYALVVAPGGIKFRAVKKPLSLAPDQGIRHLSTLDQVAGSLANWENRPVRNATGLHGVYDIPFPFAPGPEVSPLAVIHRLGLAVKPEQGKVTTLRLLHLNHLRTNCELGPGTY